MDRRFAHAMGGRRLNFIVAASLLLLGFANAGANKTWTSPAHSLQTNGVPVQIFISHGTLWHIHIDAFVYHLLDDSSMEEQGPSHFGFTLTDLIQTLVTVKLEKRNPCKNMVFGGNHSEQYKSIPNVMPYTSHQMLANWRSRRYNLRITSHICGSISSNIMSQAMAYSWSIRVHSQFKLNVTVTRFEVNYFLRCSELSVVIFDNILEDHGYSSYTLGKHCPHSIPRSFFSGGYFITLSLYILRDYISALSAPKANLAHLEFRYHVLDKNFEIFLQQASREFRPINIVNPVFKQTEVAARNGVYPVQSAFSINMAMSRGANPNTSIASKRLNDSEGSWSSSNHTITPLLPTADLMETGMFDSFQLHVIYIQAPLGMTVSVSSGSLFCQTVEGKVVFYDGPPFDIAYTDSMLVRLAEWHCQVLSDLFLSHMAYNKPHKKVRASIGDLTLIIMWNTSFPSGLFLKAKLHIDIELSGTDTIQYQNISPQGNETISVFPDPNMPSFHVLNINSMYSDDFIHLIIDTLSYEGYFTELCYSGGIFIFSDSKHVGSICSHLTAELMVNHYRKRGMKLGSFVQIVVKQYARLSRITARFHLNTSKCIGYLNLLANKAFETRGYSIIRGAQVRRFPVYYDFPLDLDLKYKMTFWEERIAHHPLVQEYWETLHIKREAEFCLSIQIVYFDHITYGTSPNTMLYLSSIEKRQYSRFEVMLSYFPTLKDSFYCEDKFRLHLDTKVNYTEILAQRPDDVKMLTAEAYNTKIHVPVNCLWKGLAFTVQMTGVEKDVSPVCFSEFGKYLYDLIQPIMPSGICGSMYLVPNLHTKLVIWEEVRLSFQKPIGVHSCCFYNLAVRMTGRADCDYYVILAMPDFLYNKVLQWEWHLLNATVPLVWQGNCFRMAPYRDSFLGLAIFDTCLDVEIYTRNPAPGCDIELSFSTGLQTFSKSGKLTQNDATQERSLCSEEVCYVSPAIAVNVTWNEARGACKEKGGHLASINSDEEWAFLTAHHMEKNAMSTLFQLLIAPVYFTGLRGQVNSVNENKIFNKGLKIQPQRIILPTIYLALYSSKSQYILTHFKLFIHTQAKFKATKTDAYEHFLIHRFWSRCSVEPLNN